jgi:hypothetical protein
MSERGIRTCFIRQKMSYVRSYLHSDLFHSAKKTSYVPSFLCTFYTYIRTCFIRQKNVYVPSFLCTFIPTFGLVSFGKKMSMKANSTAGQQRVQSNVKFHTFLFLQFSSVGCLPTLCDFLPSWGCASWS